MLGPFNPKNALNFVLIIRDKLREDWEESIQLELEKLIANVGKGTKKKFPINCENI
jgi:hypothetical protein